jgi:RNA polymerase sigma factor (sigma-70 family)
MDKLEWLDVQESDRALAERFARLGDEEAFCAIVDRHAGMVYATCRRMLGDEVEAADAAQETFLQFSKSAGHIHGSLGSWLHRVATRRAADLIRQRASRRRREESYALEAERSAPAWPSVEAAVDEVLEELPPGLRELVVMHFLEGQNTTEIAAAKAMSQPTVSRRLAEGLEELRRKLRDHGEETDAAGLLVLLLQSRRPTSKALRASLAKIAPTEPASASSPMAGTMVKLALAGAAVVLAAGAIWFAFNLNAKRQSPRPPPPSAGRGAPPLAMNNPGPIGAGQGLLPLAFDSFEPDIVGAVLSFAQPTGQGILVGGQFLYLAGHNGPGVGRFKSLGALDRAFNPPARCTANCLGIQADGKILVGGFFAGSRAPRCNLDRFDTDGAVDKTFNPPPILGVGLCLALQADGKILVGTQVHGVSRLNPDGTVDGTFSAAVKGNVSCLAIQTDGKILIGGSGFLHGAWRAGPKPGPLLRLNTDGTPDASFEPEVAGMVDTVAIQGDAKILVGGHFSRPFQSFCRLNRDGTTDTRFNSGTTGGKVNSLALQADGKVLVAGEFTHLGGQVRTGLGRLNSDGTLDAAFKPEVENRLYSIALQEDGKILVGGNGPLRVGGQERSGAGRLNNTAPATQSLAYYGSTITWLRGGTSPEVWRVTFQGSTNGSDWVDLGEGTRQAGGWQLAGLTLPPHAGIRARGCVTGGRNNGSAWFVESEIMGRKTTRSQ